MEQKSIVQILPYSMQHITNKFESVAVELLTELQICQELLDKKLKYMYTEWTKANPYSGRICRTGQIFCITRTQKFRSDL